MKIGNPYIRAIFMLLTCMLIGGVGYYVLDWNQWVAAAILVLPLLNAMLTAFAGVARAKMLEYQSKGGHVG